RFRSSVWPRRWPQRRPDTSGRGVDSGSPPMVHWSNKHGESPSQSSGKGEKMLGGGTLSQQPPVLRSRGLFAALFSILPNPKDWAFYAGRRFRLTITA